jgi:hypothetical protein
MSRPEQNSENWKPGSVHNGVAAVFADELVEREFYEGNSPFLCHNCFYAKSDNGRCPKCGYSTSDRGYPVVPETVKILEQLQAHREIGN